MLKAELIYRVSWSYEKHYFTFYVRATNTASALLKACKRLEKIGLSYYKIVSLVEDSGDIPF